MNVCLLFKKIEKGKMIVFHLKEKSENLKSCISLPVLGTQPKKQSVLTPRNFPFFKALWFCQVSQDICCSVRPL